MTPQNQPTLRRFVAVLTAVACLATAAQLLRPSGSGRGAGRQLVVYCAHDAMFAEDILKRFEDETGVTVDVRFDEEANKSLGLTRLLLDEKVNPRCDVFWNNQTLGTIRLQREGVLAPYKGPGHERIPAGFKDADGYWTGFAARLRVYIANTEAMDAEVKAPHPGSLPSKSTGDEMFKGIEERLATGPLDRVAIAQPMFGTTLTHYSVLAAEWGLEELQRWHESLHDRGIREVRGNSVVRDLVADGICDFGFTDTDDAFGALDSGEPVTMLPVRLDDGRTVVMPNSVAMISNCPHPDAAATFIEFLLSEDVEIALANSPARQIPLGPVDESRLPEQVIELKHWAADGVTLEGAAQVNQAVLNWLTAEHTGR